MNRRLQVVVALLVISLLAFGCARPDPSEGEKKNYSWNVGTGPGVWTVLGTAITDLANQDAGLREAGITLTTIPGAGSVGNILRVAQGEGEIGWSYSNFLRAAAMGVEPYEQKITGLKTVVSLGVQIVHVFAAAEVPVNSLQEIADKKFPLQLTTGRPGTGEYWAASVLFPKYGFTLDDLSAWGGKVDMLGSMDGAAAFKDRDVHAYLGVSLLQGPQFQEITSARTCKFLHVDEWVYDELVEEWGVLKVTIPGGTYPGIRQDVLAMGFPLVVLVDEKVPDIVTYTIAKVISENTEHLGTLNPMFHDWLPENGPLGTGAELHPGAAKYYRERGWIN